MKLVLQIVAAILIAKLITVAATLWLGAAALKTLTADIPTDRKAPPAQRIELPATTITVKPPCQITKADGTRLACPPQ